MVRRPVQIVENLGELNLERGFELFPDSVVEIAAGIVELLALSVRQPVLGQQTGVAIEPGMLAKARVFSTCSNILLLRAPAKSVSREE